MNALVHSANVKYAVVQVSSEPDSSGRVVLAYSDEQSLSRLIAGPSILARGFAHREEAAAVVAGPFPKSIAATRTEQEQWVSENRKCNSRFHWWKRRLAAAFDGWTHRNLACNTVQLAFASALLALYSKNIVSSIVRRMLGI